jgi:hypothetical protein
MATPLVNWIKKDVRNGNTPIVVFCGRPRSGKTAFAMRCAYELYPKKFKYEHVTGDISTFAELYSTLTNDVIILDEASDALYVYDWNSVFQKVFSVINDTQAYRHNVVFIILPMVHKLGKLHRYDVDAIIKTTKRKNYETNKPEVYYKYKIHMKNYDDLAMRPPRTMTILDWCGPVPMPPDEIWKPYIEKGQSEFKVKIMQKNLATLLKKSGQMQPQERKPLLIKH